MLKLDPTLKPSNYKQLRKMHVFDTKVQMSTPFLRNRSCNFAYKCSACPSRDLTSVLFFFFSFPEYNWSYVVRTDTCLKVSKRVQHHQPVWELHTSADTPPLLFSVASTTNNLVGHSIFTSFVDRHKNIKL